MKLRVRLENLAIGNGGFEVPSMPDKLFDIPNEPVEPSQVFEGCQYVSGAESYIIKWGFHGAVRHLQQKLIDNPKLDNATEWIFINSKPAKPDVFEAFDWSNKEVLMKGRAAIIVER